MSPMRFEDFDNIVNKIDGVAAKQGMTRDAFRGLLEQDLLKDADAMVERYLDKVRRNPLFNEYLNHRELG